MGACFDSFTVKGESETEVKKKFKIAQENDLYENGHSYSGGIGMANGLKFVDKSFSSYDEAADWLVENCQKWEEAQAVRYKDEKGKINYLVGAWCSS